MKLIDLLFENVTKDLYQDSIKNALPNYKVSTSKSGDSDFITIKISDLLDKPVGEYKRFITNATLNKTHNCDGDIRSIVDKHDIEFSKKHNLRITGENN